MARRALILPVVLVLIGLLAVTMAGFIFFVRSETRGMIAYGDAQQARLSAESGLEEVVATLRLAQHDFSVWSEMPDRFRHALVWSPKYDRLEDPVSEARSRTALFEDVLTPDAAWRFSVVGQNLHGLPDTMRFGITPESSKLDINIATDEQIQQLMLPILVELQIENAQELIDALFDWRDEDDEPRANGAENEFYNTLEPPYSVKNGPFDTIEELLLVRGFSAAVLYGEDTNRNGYLDPNEDDGEETFPSYDNGDGILDRGIAPFITIWTREPDTALDNKPRINLNGDAAYIGAELARLLEEEEYADELISEESMDFILALKQQNFNFSEVGSPAELYQGADLSEEERPSRTGPLADSPVVLEELPFIMDRFSTRALSESGPQIVAGLININTAPMQVLVLIPGMTPETAEAILAMRAELDPEDMRTTAWPMTSQAVSVDTFHQIAPRITTKAYQFHVEVLGYADHVKLYRRCEWIIEMVGPLAQIKYRRDLTRLGFAWPVDDDTVVVSEQ